MRIITHITILLTFFIQNTLCFAQESVQVVTKQIEKEFADGGHLVVVAEKATISIESWDKDQVSINLQLYAKHKDQTIAKKDIESAKYTIDNLHGIIKLTNTFSSEENDKKQSNLSASYTIKVPKGFTMNIANKYGEINIQNCYSERIVIKSSYGKLIMNTVEAKLSMESYYSDTHIENSKIEMQANSDKGDMILNNYSGKINLKSNYGELQITEGIGIDMMQIESKRTKVAIKLNTFLNSNFNINTIDGEIIIQEPYKSKIKSTGNRHNLTLNNGSRTILINTSYCPVKIDVKK